MEKFVIENDRQLKITEGFLEKFEHSVASLKEAPLDGMHPRLRQAEIDGMESKILDFKEEIEEYEKK